MIRLNAYCSTLPSAAQVKLGSSYGSFIIKNYKARKSSWGVSVRALKDETNGGTSSSAGRSWEPGLEIEVPSEQRPVNEYSSLKDGVLYSWGELGQGPFILRLGGLWLVAFMVLGVPTAAASFDPSREPLRFVLAAGTGTLFLASLIVLRIYLGWSYVGDRLLSAVIPYEESGWYDGRMWVKPPEVLARDRLLGAYKVSMPQFIDLLRDKESHGKNLCFQVKPVIKMLKQTLVGTGALLVTATLLFIFATPVEQFFQSTMTTKENPAIVPASKTKKNFNIRKEELLQLPAEVMSDDDLAAAAAEAADGRPVYCRDRYYRALAGGQYCKWEDLVK
ncbi:protein CONSERVED IN THE GREEN LINEAGE AND DIATOMS 27, chloroplastic isoform X1 [Citrus clementina]|uniref:protein CONSERVED IN THE GREEN LINEAGE AND DIATOMS 27, chloroplastic isoform X1 n=1 Tax=Citrus clementina TaxID=85681 RepID=UPI000CED6704|nr:protein CONSERVED IN THE GREEN LINEAGE AND DIATOMS 27, chloroplastic isoform X1 [Citrus x clementina]